VLLFDAQGLVHYEFIPEGRTVNKEMHIEILRRLMDAVRRKRPGKRAQRSRFLLYDGAPAHWSLVVNNTFQSTMWWLWSIRHIPRTCHRLIFFPGSSTKNALKRQRFASVEDITAKATGALTDIEKWLPEIFPKALRTLAKIYHCYCEWNVV
jgi:hypothetical protein